MTREDRHKIRQMLEEKREQIAREIDSKQALIRGGSDIEEARLIGNSDDLSAVNSDQDIDYALLELKRSDLVKIIDAIRCLDEGRYGKCTDCGKDLSLGRLKALPFAVRCTQCEENKENVEREVNKPVNKNRFMFSPSS